MKIEPFCRPGNQSNSPIWTKVLLNVEDYSINISVKNPNIPFSHYKSLGTISCHSNESSYTIGIKTLFVPPTYRCYMYNMERIDLTASEEMSFETVHDGRQTTTDDDDERTDAVYLHIL